MADLHEMIGLSGDDLATRAVNNADKACLLLISESWLNLADKIARLAGRRNTTERLVRQMFSERKSETE